MTKGQIRGSIITVALLCLFLVVMYVGETQNHQEQEVIGIQQELEQYDPPDHLYEGCEGDPSPECDVVREHQDQRIREIERERESDGDD